MAPLPTAQANWLRWQANELLEQLAQSEPLQLSPANPLLPIAWAGGLPIYAPQSCFALVIEGGGK